MLNLRSLYYGPRSLLVKSVDSIWASLIRPESLILEEWTGNPIPPQSKTQRKRLCWFAHFDPHHLIDDYVVYYLQRLHELGADLIFVSSSENLSRSEVEKILPYCQKVIRRKNIGLDFGSWAVARTVQKRLPHPLSSYDELILANDSIYGPFFSLPEIFKKMDTRDLDLWGMTTSPEQENHLQSYFLVFRGRILKDGSVNQFWNGFKYYHSKHRIIQNYEIGLSRFGQIHHWKLGAYFENQKALQHDLNPTLFAWERLIEEFEFPFLKTEVLKLNRGRSPRIAQWKEIISSQSNYDTNLINNHLKRLGAYPKNA